MREHAVRHHPIAVAHAGHPAAGRLVGFVVDRFLLLPIGAAIALVWANTAAESYFTFSQTIAFAVNEIAMALFLALVVQEVFEAVMPGGALHTWRRWGMPVIAAAGGALGAAGVYVLYVGLKYEPVLTQAWPIACAIDVAAAYYLLAFVWRRGSVLPFVLLLALATDAFGLLVLAFRPPTIAIQPWAVTLFIAALAVGGIMRARRVRTFWPYFAICGPLSWFGLYLQGVHPALALVPIVPFLPREPRSIDVFHEAPDDDAVHHFEHEWSDVVQVVLFLFGLVNGGVILRHYGTGTWAVLVAALVGRPLGILVAVKLAMMAGLHPPRRIGWPEMIVVALATSVGFTFALFLATGLIPMGPVLSQLKLGALATAVAAALTVGAARLLHVGRYAR